MNIAYISSSPDYSRGASYLVPAAASPVSSGPWKEGKLSESQIEAMQHSKQKAVANNCPCTHSAPV